MKPFSLLVMCLLPFIADGLEMAVGTAKGLVILKSSGEDYMERKLGGYSMYDVSISTLAVDSARGRVFFSRSQPSDGVLVQAMQLSPEDSDPVIETVVQKGQGPLSIRGLVYDELRDALYWTDSKKHEISTISVKGALEGQNATVIHVFEPKKHLTGIAIDACRGLLFWTNDNHRYPSVERSNLNGSDLVTIASTNLFMPMSVAVDPMGEGRLFWADNMEGNEYKIEMSKLDGSGRVVLQMGFQQLPFTISYVPSDSRGSQSGILLWSDIVNDVIWKIAVADGEKAPRMVPKEVHDFKRITTMGLVAGASFDTGHRATCVEALVAGAVVAANTTVAGEEGLSTNAVAAEEPGKEEDQPPSPLGEPITLEETSEPENAPQTPTPATEAPRRNDSGGVNSLRPRVGHDYCINGEEKKGGECRCQPGYSGPRCEKSECDNYCVHGTCVLESGSDGRWGPRCACRAGFEGRRCERDPCWKYCLNGGRCRVQSDGQPRCSCPGSGRLARGERCERFPNLLEKVCTLLCSLDSSKTSVSFVPLEGQDDEVEDVEGPLCVCPSGTSKYVYPAMKGRLNATGAETSTPAAATVASPIVLALVGVCVVLLVISLYLTFKVMRLRRLPRIKKRIIVSKGSVPLASAGCGGARGRSPSAGSSVLGEQQQCEITIENCCNMNICETPCFEPQLRSPGRSGNSKKTTTKEEKKVLLVNMEGPKTSCGPCPGVDELY